MARFDANVTSAPQVQSAQTVKAGVVDNSAATVNQGFTNALNSITGLLQQKNQTKSEMLLSEFQASQTAILDAIDQRAIDPLFGRSQLRQNLSKMILSHPSLRDDFTQLQSSILGTAGMGSQAFEETDGEARVNAQIDRAVKSGLVSADAPEADLLDAAAAQQQLDLAATQYTTSMNELNLRAKNLDVNSKEYGVWKEQRSDASLQFLQAQVRPLLSQLQENVRQLNFNTELSPSEKLRALDSYWAEVMAETSTARSQVTSTQAEALFSVLENTVTQAKEVLNGNLDLSTLETQNKARLAGSLNTLLKDPLMADYVALTKAAPGIVTVLDNIVASQVNNTLSRMLLEGNSGEDGVSIFSEGSQDYLDILSGYSDADTPETSEELAKQLSGLFTGVETASGFLAKNPKKGIALVEWMAKPEFLEMRLEHSSSITNVEAAQDILQTHYSNEVWSMIRDQFSASDVYLPGSMDSFFQALAAGAGGMAGLTQGPAMEERRKRETVPTPEAVSYVWQNGSLRFMPINPDNEGAKEKARSLNKELAPIINTTVRGMSHLEGNTNYESMFTSIEPLLFGREGIAPDVDDDPLKMNSFRGDTGKGDFKGEPENVGIVAEQLSNFGLEPHQIAGILGNLAVESFSDLRTDAVGDNGNALGIAQWNGPRKRALIAFAEEQGADVNSIDLQIAFLLKELKTTEKSAYKALLETKTAEEAAVVFLREFERAGVPKTQQRIDHANRFMEMMK